MFGPAKIAVFVDGCFWHQCPTHASIPASNRDWWTAKLDTNVARDADTVERLAAHGWLAIRVWEHEDPREAAERIALIVGERRGREGTHLPQPP